MQLTTKAQQRLQTGIEQLQNGDSTILPLNPHKPDSFQITADARLLYTIYHTTVSADGRTYYLGIKK